MNNFTQDTLSTLRELRDYYNQLEKYDYETKIYTVWPSYPSDKDAGIIWLSFMEKLQIILEKGTVPSYYYTSLEDTMDADDYEMNEDDKWLIKDIVNHLYLDLEIEDYEIDYQEDQEFIDHIDYEEIGTDCFPNETYWDRLGC